MSMESSRTQKWKNHGEFHEIVNKQIIHEINNI